jgi:transcriptional regulator with XRE-family HTH domain
MTDDGSGPAGGVDDMDPDGSPTADIDPDEARRDRHDDDHAYTESVGRRLRAIRQAQGLSLAEVEQRSSGRWSASAVGAYERGFRTLSLPRLKALADFYRVPVAVLLGESVPASSSPERRKIVLDLEALNTIDPSAPIRRFVQSIIEARGDFNGRVLSLRHDDLKALCTLVGGDIPTGVAQLRSWGVMIDGPEIPEDAIRLP